ncbi:39S ribosomal protein L15, mitochondrial-like [Panonychus citri]|uniref:39S ribosomal protein L15, mitochondrial-like n=1 Tax=Panonychus citri TaxID=50023 RepID=UPI0023074D8E|nr:39S ribosomal protein L15, mitochondrial-like [Panonychus citri]
MSSSTAEKALRLLKFMPRVTTINSTVSPLTPKRARKLQGQYARGGRMKFLNKSFHQRQRFEPAGFVDDPKSSSLWFEKVPVKDYYKDVLHRRSYPPCSLYSIQLSIDLDYLNPNEPIDLTTLCRDVFLNVNTDINDYGTQLTNLGQDIFSAQINIEVQYASEEVIAAIERNGGVITTAFYDIKSVMALTNPTKFFSRGEPIPKRLLPPPDCIDYYTNPVNRGYLADPDAIAEERLKLAQKYGYTLPDLSKDPKFKMLSLRKDPQQIFYGLEPGWVVNLKDKQIMRPIKNNL